MSESKRNSELKNTSERLRKKRRELEDLKDQVQQLVDMGSRPAGPPNNSTRLLSPEAQVAPKSVTKSREFLACPSPRTPSQRATKSAVTPNKEEPRMCPKKKSYDVESARKFMHKQKVKKKEQTQEALNMGFLRISKKQRLDELQKRTRELVVRNVARKRSRSVDCLKSNADSGRKDQIQRSKSSDRDFRPVPVVPPGVATIDHNLLYPYDPRDEEVAQQVSQKTPALSHQMPKDNKETQTSQRGDPPKATFIQPSPYNFINSVKRKLQTAVNSSKKACVHVGVQNAAISSKAVSPSNGDNLNASHNQSREEMLKLSVRRSSTPKESFISHRLPNLDLEAVENLELRPRFRTISSDSDTSKNIPDISSESLPSYSKASSSATKLSTENINSLKLKSVSYSDDFYGQSQSEEIERNVRVSNPVQSLSNGFHSSAPIATECPNTKGENGFLSLEIEGYTTAESQSAGESPKAGCKLSSRQKLLPFTQTKPRGFDERSNVTVREAADRNDIYSRQFEAEVHLLNDFHQSFNQLRDVEKSFEELKRQSCETIKILPYADPQTSVLALPSSSVTSKEHNFSQRSLLLGPSSTVTSGEYDRMQRSLHPSINYSRDSDILEEVEANATIMDSTVSTRFSLSNMNVNESSDFSMDTSNMSVVSVVNIGHLQLDNFAGMSLQMFEQLIKEEDARLNQLKCVIKIREQALLDRTKVELSILEQQKRQLKETGKIEEASLVKKKQRGILLKLEQERNEMSKLKQMNKDAIQERKNDLKKQKSLIKSRLSSDNMLSKIKISPSRERRSIGPLKVVQSEAETSISRRSSSALSRSLSLRISEDYGTDAETSIVHVIDTNKSDELMANARRALLMKQVVLQQRRKAAERLLRWREKLLEEEKKIVDLEKRATSVVGLPKKYSFTGKQLNRLWKKLKKSDNGNFIDDEVYTMSRAALDALFKNSKPHKNKQISESVSSAERNTEETIKTASEDEYSSLFDAESVREDQTKISSISELINNFNSIGDEINLISKKSEEDINLLKNDVSVFEDLESASFSLSHERTVEEKQTEISSHQNFESPNSTIDASILVEEKTSSILEVSAKPSTSEIEEKEEDGSRPVESRTETRPKVELIPQVSLDSLLEYGAFTDEDLEEALQAASSIEESITRLNKKLTSDEDNVSSATTISSNYSTEERSVDVKKRVSEILADASSINRDKSPRLQDLYVTTYDVTPEPVEENEEDKQLPNDILGSEAEELRKQQLAIEQEIKQLELQQKETLPYVYLREIPNKPPPPYTPPTLSPSSESIIPRDAKQIDEITNYSSKILQKAFERNTLEDAKFSQNSFKLCSTLDVPIQCAEYLFSVCKDLAKEHYNQFQPHKPPWMVVKKQAAMKPLDADGLEKYLNKKLKQLLHFEEEQRSESALIKWGRKKRDHVDEILVAELQEEEAQWVNFDEEVLEVVDQMTDRSMQSLLQETGVLFENILSKKNGL